MALKFYTSMAKGLQVKVRKFWGLIPTFVEVTEEKLVGGAFCLFPILNRVKVSVLKNWHYFLKLILKSVLARYSNHSF